jgi:tetratricopeptide (TPR) repeat protein
MATPQTFRSGRAQEETMTPEDSSTDFDKLWDYNQPAESETRFRQALAETPVGSPTYVEVLTQIARAQGLQRNFDAAHKTLDEAQRLLHTDWRRPHLRYLLERGRVLNSAGKKEQAHPLFQQAWELAQSAGEDYYAVDAAHMLAIIARPAQQLAWNLKALALAERSGDPRTRNWLGSLYNNIGWTYHDLGQDEQALATFQKALVWREAANQPTETRIARWCVARFLRSLARVEVALVVQQQLAKEWGALGENDGYVFEELGECLLALDRPGEAAAYFARAHDILSQDPWLVANEDVRLERLRQLGSRSSATRNEDL